MSAYRLISGNAAKETELRRFSTSEGAVPICRIAIANRSLFRSQFLPSQSSQHPQLWTYVIRSAYGNKILHMLISATIHLETLMIHLEKTATHEPLTRCLAALMDNVQYHNCLRHYFICYRSNISR